MSRPGVGGPHSPPAEGSDGAARRSASPRAAAPTDGSWCTLTPQQICELSRLLAAIAREAQPSFDPATPYGAFYAEAHRPTRRLLLVAAATLTDLHELAARIEHAADKGDR